MNFFFNAIVSEVVANYIISGPASPQEAAYFATIFLLRISEGDKLGERSSSLTSSFEGICRFRWQFACTSAEEIAGRLAKCGCCFLLVHHQMAQNT